MARATCTASCPLSNPATCSCSPETSFRSRSQEDTGLSWRWFSDVFAKWVEEVPAGEVVAIGGNHDFLLEQRRIGPGVHRGLFDANWTYLQDAGTTLACGLTVWGTPWSPGTADWAFMGHDHELDRVLRPDPSRPRRAAHPHPAVRKRRPSTTRTRPARRAGSSPTSTSDQRPSNTPSTEPNHDSSSTGTYTPTAAGASTPQTRGTPTSASSTRTTTSSGPKRATFELSNRYSSDRRLRGVNGVIGGSSVGRLSLRARDRGARCRRSDRVRH